MNYNEEMALLFDDLNLDYKLEQIKYKATPKDYIDLENRIKLREEENKKFNSENKESSLCLSLSVDRRKKWKLKKQ